MVEHSDPDVKSAFQVLGGSTVDLTKSDTIIDFIYFAPPEVEIVSGLDPFSPTCPTIVLDKGHIVDIGTHQELMDRPGHYRAAALIQQLLIELADRGAAILVISQDLDELFQIAGRIAVISGGRLSPARPVTELTVETIGREMGAGASRELVHA